MAVVLRIVAIASVALSRSVSATDGVFVDAAVQAVDEMGPILLTEQPFLTFGFLTEETPDPIRAVSAVAMKPPVAAPIVQTALPAIASPAKSERASTLAVPTNTISNKVGNATKPMGVSSGHSSERSDHSLTNHLGEGIDMLRLVQAISARKEWSLACNALVSKIRSEEGSVTEEYALGYSETPLGTNVFTFDSQDQARLGRCAAQLKLIAVEAGILGGMASPSSTSLLQSDITQSAASMIGNADELEAIIDSPWARDACQDIAHGFLTARLAHPEMKSQDFCPMYAKDLGEMRDDSPSAAVLTAKSEAKKLRRHSDARLKIKTKEAVAAKAARTLALKAKEDAAKLEEAKKEAAAKAKAEAKAMALMLAEAKSDSVGFLHDAATANVANAGVVDWELDHPDGQDLQRQLPQQVEHASAGAIVKTASSQHRAALAVRKVAPSTVRRSPSKVASAVTTKPAAKSPAKPESGADADGAAFWGEMFQG